VVLTIAGTAGTAVAASRSGLPARLAAVTVAVAVLAMVATPAAWAVSTLVPPYGGNKIGPAAGPTSTLAGGMGLGGGPGGAARAGGRAFPGGGFPNFGAQQNGGGPPIGGGLPNGGGAPNGGGLPNGGGRVDSSVVDYLQAHQGSAKYAVAITDANSAGPYIMAGLSVLPIGGFSGQVPFPTLSQFQSLVASGQLRYVLVGGRGGGPGGRGDSSISSYATQNCTAVSAVSGLYDCAAG
jgi:hypothetical protein